MTFEEEKKNKAKNKAKIRKKKKDTEADDTLAQSLRDRGRSNECDLDGSD